MEIKSFGSICSGVGMQEMAYKKVFNDNIKYYAEIDKFAIKSYEAIHGDIKNLGDFTQARNVENVEFMFASTPCQDFSTAGKQKGFEGMRGTLTFEWLEMLRRLKGEGKLPKVIGFENVPGIISKKFLEGFNVFKKELEKIGFYLYQGKLNAKKYGIPQNRDRVFLQGFQERTNFVFPKEIILVKRLKDMLESSVNEKFYLPKEKVELFLKQGNVNPSGKGMNGSVNTKNISCTLTTNKGEGPKILIGASRGRNTENPNSRVSGLPTEQRLEFNYNETSNCITTVQKDNLVIENLRIRRLTPKEVWRLMGISDDDFYKAQEVNSNSQLYKQAGNGIVVNVLEAIFREIKKCKVVKNEPKYDILPTGEKQFLLF